MSRAGGFLLILLSWCAFSLIFIFGILFAAPIFNDSGLTFLVSASSKNIYETPEGSNPAGAKAPGILATIKGEDSRIVLVDRFLAKYHSPMVGLGKEFIAAADSNGLDWRLLPAIAFQESNLGKKIPRGSYNPFGWAIYEGKNSGAYFNSWTEAINIVALRISQNYSTVETINPETIVFRYTSRQNPSWVFAVRAAMEEISPTVY